MCARRTFWFVFVTLVVSLVACSATKQARDVGFSGFLGDYSKLVRGSEGQELYVYNNPKGNWAAYNKILLDPVMIWQDPESLQKLPQEDLQRLADFLHNALREELKKDYAGRMEVEFIDVWKDPDAGKAYKVEMIPTQIFYDAGGKELFRHVGFFGREDILAQWKQLGVDLAAVEKK